MWREQKKVWILTACVLLGGVVLAFLLGHMKSTSQEAPPSALSGTAASAAYAGSESCRECHQQEYTRWKDSHHALAERALDPALDRHAFDPPQTFRHGTQTSQAQVAHGRFEVVTLGREGTVQPYPVERIIGVDPLRQFLVAAPGGRYQVTEVAFDPARKDWFNVYGSEDRQPGEWGHWSGRGMTWNSMCAVCHNTHLRKNYDEASDTYATTRAEMGVGCEACHGPMAAHVAWQRARSHARDNTSHKDPTILRLTEAQTLSVCGSCHSRRGELTGDFRPGGRFLDHYTPVIPDETDIYHPDGQVRDEDFEYVSFLGSRMYSLSVRCLDCHEAHSGKTHATGNDLCLRCHKRKIDPAAHSHHPLGKDGSRCVDCHMPITVYMARHPRRDHGFTIPDPLLTKEHGVPNACNRCHTDRTVDWAMKWVQRWYGAQVTKRHTARRARWVAAARAGDDPAFDNLSKMARQEKIALWRAVAVGLLKHRSQDETVRRVLLASTSDPAPLVRGMAARALEPAVSLELPEVDEALRRLLRDPVRMVRIEAAWALRAVVETDSRAGKDLERYLKHNLDQPIGAFQTGIFHLDRGHPETALVYFRRAVAWDPNSPTLRSPLAVALNILGKKEEAAHELRTACRLAPRDAALHFNLGLALAEVGEMGEAATALEKTVQLDPNFARAWYNLGLARDAVGKPDMALAALMRAESLDPTSARIPYARATILHRLGRLPEARAAAHRVLALDPNDSDARNLLRALTAR